jgi:hypothetical protein
VEKGLYISIMSLAALYLSGQVAVRVLFIKALSESSFLENFFLTDLRTAARNVTNRTSVQWGKGVRL